MKKILTICLIAAMAVSMLSCSTRRAAINDLESLVEKVEKNGEEYTLEDWENVIYRCAKIEKKLQKHGNLRRAGLICGLDSTFKNVNYYALGPWENTVDRKDGVVVGRYKTTVDQMADPYVKPQSSGSREGLREVTFTDNNGNGVKIATEGNVSFSALPYTDEDLMRAGHYWEMTKRPYTVLHLDAWMRGIGNASCGHDVGTLPEYCVPNEKMSYKLRITPVVK